MATCVRNFNAKVRTRRVKVGRAVHCTPRLVVRTWLVGLNLVFRALSSAATARAPYCRKKPRHAPSTSTALRPRWPCSNLPPARDRSDRRRAAAKMAARQSLPKGAKVQSVGRARPACAGRAAIHTPGKVRRAEDCPPYQSGCDGARH